MLSSFHLDSIDRIIILALLYLFSSTLNTQGYQTSNKPYMFIYAGCSQEKYQPDSQFEANLNSFLASVLSSSSQFSYHSFAIGNGSNSTMYGLYQCRGDLQPIDCKRCVETLVQEVGLVCPYSFGVALQLEGCYIRYEVVNFLGKVDISPRYKRCRRSVGNDAEFFRRRDDVLGSLMGGSGFRVSRSGFVEGVAQCVGDLSAQDCSSCLVEAVGKVKSLCGSAAAADLFLAQCYARYRAFGYYDQAPDSSKEEQVGKATAIIVGLLAALAILVVILSICQRAMGKHNIG